MSSNYKSEYLSMILSGGHNGINDELEVRSSLWLLPCVTLCSLWWALSLNHRGHKATQRTSTEAKYVRVLKDCRTTNLKLEVLRGF